MILQPMKGLNGPTVNGGTKLMNTTSKIEQETKKGFKLKLFLFACFVNSFGGYPNPYNCVWGGKPNPKGSIVPLPICSSIKCPPIHLLMLL